MRIRRGGNLAPPFAPRYFSPDSTCSTSRCPFQTNALQGMVNAITGYIWTINGQNVIVDSQTSVINTTGVANWVTVKAVIQSDGSLLALEINPGAAIASR